MDEIRLSDLDLSTMTSGWHAGRRNLNNGGGELVVGTTRFADGVGTAAPSRFEVEIRGAARRFRAKVGVDAAYRRGKADFVVRTNGVEALHTPPLAAGEPPRTVEVPLAGVRRVELAVRAGGDSPIDDLGNWCEAVFEVAPGTTVVPVDPTAAMRDDRALISQQPVLSLAEDGVRKLKWMTSEPATGRAEWSQDGGRTWTGAWDSRDGSRDAHELIHEATLAGVDPSRPLAYRVLSRGFVREEPYDIVLKPEEARAEGTAASLVGSGGAVGFVLFSDVHRNLDVYEKLVPLVRAPVSFAAFAGDIISWVEDEEDVRRNLLSPLAWVSRRLGCPVRYVRGNHELRGRFARHLRDYLPLQDGRYYGAVTAGAARFVFLDTGESENGDTAKNAGLNDTTAYLLAERDWLARETASPAWREAKARIVIGHAPTGPTTRRAADGTLAAAGPVGVRGLDAIEAVLAKAEVTCFFAGHYHTCGFYEPIPERPYPLAMNGGDCLEDERETGVPVLLRCDISADGDLAVTWTDRWGNERLRREVKARGR